MYYIYIHPSKFIDQAIFSPFTLNTIFIYYFINSNIFWYACQKMSYTF